MAHPPMTRSRPRRLTKPMANSDEANRQALHSAQLPGVLSRYWFSPSRTGSLSVGTTNGIEPSAATNSTPQCKAWAPSLERALRSLAWALAPTITHAAAPKSELWFLLQSSQQQSVEPSQGASSPAWGG